MKLLLLLSLLFSYATYAQTADSVRLELTTEPVTAAQNADTSERAVLEKKTLKELFRSSRKETTMFQLGIMLPAQFEFIGNRALRERYSYGGLWIGVNRKLTPSFGLRGGALWNPGGWFSSTKAYRANGDTWMGQVAIDYYPFIKKRIQNGKSANNFFNNPYITLETWRLFSGATRIEQATGVSYKPVSFRQTVGLGVGVTSNRTRVFFYTLSLTAAYGFDRPADVKHAVQLMFATSFGLAI